jgi:hypothetical protein
MDQIEEVVDRLYRELPGSTGERCEFPVIGGGFIKGEDSTVRERRLACLALAAREWFAKHGPPDAPPLPLSYDEREGLKRGDLGHLVALYARSLAAQDYDVEKHPSFHDYACGVMASGLRPSHNEELCERFPPRPLDGLDNGLYWSPPRRRSKARAWRRPVGTQ